MGAALTDRRAGKPVDMDVRMEAESILYRTIWLFVGAFVAAIVVLAVIWITVRRGKHGRLECPPTLRS